MRRFATPVSAMTRRDVLRALGALGVGATYASFTGCSCSDDASRRDAGKAPDAGPFVDATALRNAEGGLKDGGTVFDALDALRALIRTSPDHLQARAEDVVKTKDPTKIAEFVRDHVTVLPGIGREDDPDVATYSRWGAAATLRAGAGSLRDRVDLMVELLRAAGIASIVKSMPAPSDLTASVLYRPRVNDFSIDQTALIALMKASGRGAIAQSAPTSLPDGSADFDAAVAAVLSGAASSVNGLPTSALPVPSKIPVVVVGSSPGTTATALVAVGDQAVATVDPTTLTPAVDANFARVNITVSALMNPPAGGGSPSFVDLVQGSWPVDQVAGHQVNLLFLPLQGAKEVLYAPLSGEHVRVPMIRIQPRPGADLDPYANSLAPPGADAGLPPVFDAGPPHPPAVNPPNIAMGSAFSIEGEILSDPSTSSNGPLVVLDDTAHASAVAKVAKIAGTVNARAYPTVELDLSITDSTEASVDGLGAADLTVTDGTTNVPIAIVANRTPPHEPRVLVVYDGSGSITNFWPSTAARQAFEQNLATILTGIAAQHPFETQVVGLAQAVNDAGWAPPTVAGLTAGMESAGPYSDVWATFVGSAVDSGPAVIVMVSDFDDPDTTYIAAAKERLTRSGIPVIALTVGTVNEAIASQVAAVSGGTEVAASSSTLGSVIGPIIDKAVTQEENVTYRLRYDAPSTGGSPRPVTVALSKKSSISVALSYDVPPASAQTVPPSVAGVYVTIAFGNVTERRRLGGAAVSYRGAPQQDLDDASVVADARAVLNGLTTIAFEPASPTLAAVLDDIVLAHRSMKPLIDVWTTNDIDTFARAAARMYRFPGIFAALLPGAPPDPTAPIVVPRGLRVAVLTEREVNGKFLQQIDVPPRLNAARALRAGAADLEAVMRATLRLTASESLVFDETAYGSLANRSLVVSSDASLPTGVLSHYASSPSDALNFTNLNTEYSDLIRLVPSDGGTVAFWVVDPTSGSVTAIDASGRGGGGSVADISLFEALNLAVFALGLGCTLGITPFPLYCVSLNVTSVLFTVAGLFHPSPATVASGAGSAVGFTRAIPKTPFGNGSAGVTLLLIILYLISIETFDQ